MCVPGIVFPGIVSPGLLRCVSPGRTPGIVPPGIVPRGCFPRMSPGWCPLPVCVPGMWIERFPRPRSLANYFGLTPSSRNSGESQHRLGSITKQGSNFARFLLGQLIVHVLKKDRRMRGWYRRITLRRGSKIARVAVMRRVATIFWHILTYREGYTMDGPPARLAHRQPHPFTSGAA